MKTWKPFERWTDIMGNRIEHQIHADFELDETEMLSLIIGKHNRRLVFEPNTEIEPITEIPPPGKVYKVHLRIALEEFEKGGKT